MSDEGADAQAEVDAFDEAFSPDDEERFGGDSLPCGCCACCGCYGHEDDEADEDEEPVGPTRAEADPVGFAQAGSAIALPCPTDVYEAFMAEWLRPATGAELQVRDFRQIISTRWDRQGPGDPPVELTREERIYLVREFFPPDRVGLLVLDALRAGYERGRRGGPR